MKKIMRRGIPAAIAIVMLLAAVMMTGCDETKPTLEDIASANSELSETITEKMETPAGTTVDIAFSGDSFDVTYTYEDVVDEDLTQGLVSAFDKNEDKIKESCQAAIETLQTETGISGIMGTLNIVNANGSELWTRTYPEQ